MGGIRVFQCDATLYDNYDDYTYFYLFNPFTEIIMIPFIHHLKESAKRHPRDIHVIYANPAHHNLFLAEGFNLVKHIPHSWLKCIQEIDIYVLPRESV